MAIVLVKNLLQKEMAISAGIQVFSKHFNITKIERNYKM